LNPEAVRNPLLYLLLVLTAPLAAAPLHVDVRDGAGQPLADAVVFLESAEARRQVRPLEQAEMGQAGKQFVPQVLVVPVGTAVNFPNRDTVRHHVYSFSPAKKFELKLYIGTPAQPVLFDRPGVVVLGCNIHDQMVGWILVVPTPYYARTGADGRAVIDAPAGRYRLRSWHPGLPVGAPAQDQAWLASGSAQDVLVRMPDVRP
jgi:plastocyanin